MSNAQNASLKSPVWIVVTLLALIPLLMVLGNSALIPVMPTMQRELHITKFQVSLLITLFSVPAGIVIPFAGFLSDRISRKWIVGPALLLFGAGGVLAGCASWWFSKPYTFILIARVIQGIGASGTAPIAMAWVGDLFTGSQRSKVLGINEAGNAFGKVVSPIIGAAIALISWFMPFFIFPILCIPMALGVWFLLPSQSGKKSQQSVKDYVKSVGAVFKAEGRWLLTGYLAGAAALFTLFGVLFYLSDLLETKYKMDGIIKGLVLAIPLVVLSATSFTVGAIIQKKQLLMKWLIVSGFAILASSLVTAAWLASNAWILIGLMAVGALGTGCVLPCLNMFITSAVSTEQRGIVTSFYGSVRFLGVAAGPPVFTWLLTFSPQVMMLSVAGLATLCGVLTALLIRPTPTNPTAKGGSSVHHPTPVAARHRARA